MFTSGLVMLLMLLMQFRRYWMPRDEERHMIAPWDSVQCDIRRQTLSQGVGWTAIGDTNNLHRDHVISALCGTRAAACWPAARPEI